MADPVIDSLQELRAAFARARESFDLMEERAAELSRARASDRPFTEIVHAEARPLVVERLSAVLEDLAAAGAAFRRAEARALREEGLSQEAIAALFGVSRQRIAALLAEPRGSRQDG